MATNYNAMVEALRSKESGYLHLFHQCPIQSLTIKVLNVLLKSKGYLVDDKGNPTNKLVDYYRSQIVVRKDSHLHKLKGFKRDKVGLQDPESTSGYIYQWQA